MCKGTHFSETTIIFIHKKSYFLYFFLCKHETAAVTIPVRDRNLLQEIVRRFGWVCVF